MKNIYILILFLIVFTIEGFSQSIRKNYQEMTDAEKVSLVNAFYQLRTGADRMNDIANFHNDFFNFDNTPDPTQLDIHLNLPDEPERDIFLGWHRRQMMEVEQAMQAIDPNLSIPFWDTSTDQSINSPLWDQNFLGQFDADWVLGRALGGFGSLPSPQDVVNVQSNTNYLDYSNDMERGGPHTGAHQWVGGAMRSPLSPRDPVFYFHHSNVDRLWSLYQAANQNSSFIMTTMLRYDGTYVFDGQTLPVVNPNDLVNTKSLGIFYAENQLAELDSYTVSNTFNAQESFYYQFTVHVGNNFLIPSGTNCKIESFNEIILQPGFDAAVGSNFIARIDPAAKIAQSKPGLIVRNQIPYSDRVLEVIDFSSWETEEITVLKSYPNPFTNRIVIELSKESTQVKIAIYNLMGQSVREATFDNAKSIEIDNLENLSRGFYILKVVEGNNRRIYTAKLVKI